MHVDELCKSTLPSRPRAIAVKKHSESHRESIAVMASRRGAFALVAALCLLELARRGLAEEPAVPAMFVFGDSTVDVGNNNFLANCKANCKANYPRYGVDYPFQSPTGRFSNGYNLADQLGM